MIFFPDHPWQAFKMSRADSCTSGIVIVFRIVIQTKIAWKVHFSFMFWRCYCQLLFLSQLTQYWLILLILCSWSSKSVSSGFFCLHNLDWNHMVLFIKPNFFSATISDVHDPFWTVLNPCYIDLPYQFGILNMSTFC